MTTACNCCHQCICIPMGLFPSGLLGFFPIRAIISSCSPNRSDHFPIIWIRGKYFLYNSIGNHKWSSCTTDTEAPSKSQISDASILFDNFAKSFKIGLEDFYPMSHFLTAASDVGLRTWYWRLRLMKFAGQDRPMTPAVCKGVYAATRNKSCRTGNPIWIE